MKVGYIRVSSLEQNLDRQIRTMEEKGCEKIFSEKVSGKSVDNREQLQNMISFIRQGDVVYVSSYDRLARNTLDLLQIVKQIEEKGATLISEKEKIDTSTPAGALFLVILGGIASFERDMIRLRQREGIEIAKSKGLYKGKKAKDLVGIEDYYTRWKNREVGISDIAKHYKVSRQTVYNHFSRIAPTHIQT